MTDLPPWTLPQFEQYVDIALESMAKHGALRADASGQPICKRGPAGRTEDGTLRIEVTANLPASGLSPKETMTASTHGAGPVTWSLGGVPIATIPAEWMPEEAGEAIARQLVREVNPQDAESGLVARSWVRTSRKGGRLTERTLEGEQVKVRFIDRGGQVQHASGTVRRNDAGQLVVESFADNVRKETAVSRGANAERVTRCR